MHRMVLGLARGMDMFKEGLWHCVRMPEQCISNQWLTATAPVTLWWSKIVSQTNKPALLSKWSWSCNTTNCPKHQQCAICKYLHTQDSRALQKSQRKPKLYLNIITGKGRLSCKILIAWKKEAQGTVTVWKDAADTKEIWKSRIACCPKYQLMHHPQLRETWCNHCSQTPQSFLPTFKLILSPLQNQPNTNFTNIYLNCPAVPFFFFFLSLRLKSTDPSFYMFEYVSLTEYHSMKKIGNNHMEKWNQEVCWLNITPPELWWQSHATSHVVSIWASS